MSYQQPPGDYPPYGQPNPYNQPNPYSASTVGSPYQPSPSFGGSTPDGQQGGSPKTDHLAIIALVLSIISFPAMCLCYLGVPGYIAAIVLAILSIVRINKEPSRFTGKGMAFAAIAVTVGGFLLFVLLALLGFAANVLKDMPH